MTQPNQRLPKGERLTQRCKTLAAVVRKLRPLYQKKNAITTQKDLLETIIGAAIWYLPECDELFSGKMSSKALKACERDRTEWGRLTKDHCYTRKRAGADLLKSKAKMTGVKMMDGYKRTWGRYHRVTKKEHHLITALHKKRVFRMAYKKAGVNLVNAPDKFWKRKRTLRAPLGPRK